MQRKRKIALWIVIVMTSMIAIYYMGWSFAPGSYARAEIYELEVPH
jgi:hypothetical protein